MDGKTIQDLFAKTEAIKVSYEQHFNTSFPERIIGWWDPLNITQYPDELVKGVAEMEKDVNAAIAGDRPLPEIPIDQWNKMIF